MRNWPYAGKTFICKGGLGQEHKLHELRFKVGNYHINGQEETEMKQKFVHLLREWRAISELP
jgi:hypothetical protein